MNYCKFKKLSGYILKLGVYPRYLVFLTIIIYKNKIYYYKFIELYNTIKSYKLYLILKVINYIQY